MKSLFTSSEKVIILIVSFFISLILISNQSHPFIGCKSDAPVSKNDSVVPWKYPDVSSISDNDEGKMIKFGRKIFIETYKYIGPAVEDTSKRYLGANMDCQNCHFNAGTQQNVFGLVGSYSHYPAMDARVNKIISIQERINSCMTRSMNGKAIPETSSEMNALVAYLKWLSTDVPKGKTVEGNGVPKINLIDRAADTANGRIVFAQNCTTCHAENGYGVLRSPGTIDIMADSLRGYDFPPVMGPDSYNDGAGMYRLLTATAFIYVKMPLNRSDLSLDKSYDVAAFINSVPRPKKANLEKDYPNLKLKPLDAPFAPYDDNFTESQHKYGPYRQMIIDGEKSKMIDPNTAR